MKTALVATLACFALLVAGHDVARGAAAGSDAALLKALPASKQSLAAGVKQAQARFAETAISGKFEMDDKGQLSLSVYTAEKGLSVDAEHNVLKELSGSPTGPKWSPETEIFKDVPHVSRSAQQLAVMALSKLSLLDVIEKAGKDQAGTAYSVIPVVKDRKALFQVLVASGGSTVELWYDAMTGTAVKAGK